MSQRTVEQQLRELLEGAGFTLRAPYTKAPDRSRFAVRWDPPTRDFTKHGQYPPYFHDVGQWPTKAQVESESWRADLIGRMRASFDGWWAHHAEYVKKYTGIVVPPPLARKP